SCWRRCGRGGRSSWSSSRSWPRRWATPSSPPRPGGSTSAASSRACFPSAARARWPGTCAIPRAAASRCGSPTSWRLRSGPRRDGLGWARLVPPPTAGAPPGPGRRPPRGGPSPPPGRPARAGAPRGRAPRQRRRQLPGLLRVYPPFKSRQEAELRIDRARILEVGLRSARGQGGGTEFDSLREYGVDDESRRIDWAATARTTRVIVRTYRAERNQTVLLLLDTGRTM